ncbi:MAG: SH3 domain-containing protein [Puniceicoccales bacterium]|jgi:tetratricopeptide (TPR) repeat protein|nr:SH3 domain-containing protein [Puniceicoccales bacterium]
MKNLLVYCFLLCWAARLVAQDDLVFHKASEAYGGQNYARAIELLENTPTHSFARYFNLGCAYQKNGDTARAWIAFEKARQIKPYDKNLRAALRSLPLTPEQRPFIPLYQTSFFINIFLILACIFFWRMVGIWLRYRAKKTFRRGCFYFNLLNFLICVGFFYGSSIIFRKCITVTEHTALHISPTPQSEVIDHLPAGTPLAVQAKYGNFLHINLKNNQNGWIDAQNVKYIYD